MTEVVTSQLGPRPPRNYGLNFRAVFAWERQRINLEAQNLRAAFLGATLIEKSILIEELGKKSTRESLEATGRARIGKRFFAVSRTSCLVDVRDFEPQSTPGPCTTRVRVVLEGYRGGDSVPELSNIADVGKSNEPILHVPLNESLDYRPEHVLDNMYEAITTIWNADQFIDIRRRPLAHL